jgi:hypothetical protein
MEQKMLMEGWTKTPSAPSDDQEKPGSQGIMNPGNWEVNS